MGTRYTAQLYNDNITYTHLLSQLVVGRLTQFHYWKLYFRGIVNDRKGSDPVGTWVLDLRLHCIQSSLGLGPQRLPVPVKSILNRREPTAYRRGRNATIKVAGSHA